jgi:hypothetical protein
MRAERRLADRADVAAHLVPLSRARQVSFARQIRARGSREWFARFQGASLPQPIPFARKRDASRLSLVASDCLVAPYRKARIDDKVRVGAWPGCARLREAARSPQGRSLRASGS